ATGCADAGEVQTATRSATASRRDSRKENGCMTASLKVRAYSVAANTLDRRQERVADAARFAGACAGAHAAGPAPRPAAATFARRVDCSKNARRSVSASGRL